MIKRFIACLSLLLLLTLLPLGGLRSQAAPGISPNIIDEADILNPERESSIAAEIARLEGKYQTNIVFLSVTEMTKAELNGGVKYYDIQAFTEDYYDYIYCGGTEKDGIILCVNMEPNNREFCVVTTGKEINRFQKHMRYIYDRIYEDLHRTEYDAAAETYLKLIDTKYRLGFYPPSMGTVALCCGIGLLAGWLVTRGMRGSMNNVALATSASHYVVPGSFNVRRQHEMFLYSNVTQVARQQERTGGGGGGGGIHIGSSGISHGGGGGMKF